MFRVKDTLPCFLAQIGIQFRQYLFGSAKIQVQNRHPCTVIQEPFKVI